MRKIFKQRTLKLLNNLRWTFMSANFLVLALSKEDVKFKPKPSVCEVRRFLVTLKQLGYLNVRRINPDENNSNRSIQQYQIKENTSVDEICKELKI